MGNYLLHTEKLEFGYKSPLTLAVSLFAEAGDIICVIGRNGSGKSTLLNTLTGVLPLISGKIFLQDQDISKISIREKSKQISFVPSKPEFMSNLTVYELAAMGRAPYTNVFDTKSPKDHEIIEQALKEFNLTTLKNNHLWAISDGERQRAMICRAFIQQTPVIILDEPTAFLDYYVRQKLLADLKALTSNKGKCIIFSSHDIEISLKYANKIWLFGENSIKSYSVTDFVNSGILSSLLSFENK